MVGVDVEKIPCVFLSTAASSAGVIWSGLQPYERVGQISSRGPHASVHTYTHVHAHTHARAHTITDAPTIPLSTFLR